MINAFTAMPDSRPHALCGKNPRCGDHFMAALTLKRYFGDRAFYRSLAAVIIPVMAQQFVTSFVNLIDNIMVGQIGQTALTTVTVANRFYMIANSILLGLCGAASIFIAQNYGADNRKMCQRFFNVNMRWAITVMLMFTAVLFISPSFAITVFSKTPELVELGTEYVKWIRLTYIPFAISFSCMLSLRAIGMNRLSLTIGIMAVFVNVIFNYLLIFGKCGFPQLGVRGAAIATVIARVVEMLAYIFVMLRGSCYFNFDIKGLFKPDREVSRALITKALPLTANELLYSLGMSMVFKSYMRTDEMLVAAVSVVDTVINILFIIFSGLSSAVAIFIGGKLGSGDLEGARAESRKILVFGIILAIAFGGICFLVAPIIPGFYKLDDVVNEALVTLIRTKSILLPAYVVNGCTFFILRAGGDTTSTFIMDSVFLWAANVFISTMLSVFTNIGLVPLYILIECLDIPKMGLALWAFKRERWVRNLAAEKDEELKLNE